LAVEFLGFFLMASYPFVAFTSCASQIPAKMGGLPKVSPEIPGASANLATRGCGNGRSKQ
jgi:hypothetical protein